MSATVFLNASEFGATGSGDDETAIIQDALDHVPETGGTIHIPAGVKFRLTDLIFPQSAHLLYRHDDDLSAPSPRKSWVLHMANASAAGLVNNAVFAAAYHPAVAVRVRENVEGHDTFAGEGQSRTQPARASYVLDHGLEEVGRWTYQRYCDSFDQFSGVYLNAFVNRVTLNGITTSSFTTCPVPDALVRGNTSGARGYLLSIDSAKATVEWVAGRFVAGESVRDSNETSVTTLSSASFTAAAGHNIGWGLRHGLPSIGVPPEAPIEAWTVGGFSVVQPTRSMSQHIVNDRTLAGRVWMDWVENEIPKGFVVVMDPSSSDSSRRLTLRKYANGPVGGDRANLGAVIAHGQFRDDELIAGGSFNLAGVTKNGTGDYTLRLSIPTASDKFQVHCTTGDTTEYAVWNAKTKDGGAGGTATVRIRVVDPATNTPKNLSQFLDIIITGGDIDI